MKVVKADPNVADVQGDEGGDMNDRAEAAVAAASCRPTRWPTNCARKLRNIPGTAITFTNPPIIRIGGRRSRSTYQYTLAGPGPGRVAAGFASSWRRRCRTIPPSSASTATRTRWRPSVQVAIDRARAAALGVDAGRDPEHAGPGVWRPAGVADLCHHRPVSGDPGASAAIPARRHRPVAALPARHRRGDGAADGGDADQPAHHAAHDQSFGPDSGHHRFPSIWRPARR